ncbi:MAG: VWA domain-containing protein [Bowdeniella nasicola]|nr:VWA domain-containing protein [Bowdeniella nasicola]
MIAGPLNSLVWWPLTLALWVLIILVALVAWRWHRRRRVPDGVPVAHTGVLRRLPAYVSAVRARRRRLLTAAIAIGIAALSSAALAGRPADVHTESEQLATRDIVLCLDVSGSMISYDSEILEKFASLVENFQGERIALVMWNNTARTLFPLTDDYVLVHEELEHAAQVLDVDVSGLVVGSQATRDVLDLLAGTTALQGTSASLIGDGLANCVLSFDLTDTERSRSIILATDNDLQGEPVYQLSEAMTFAQERDIRVIGLFSDTAESADTGELREAFKRDVEGHGGLVFDTTSPEAVDAIIDEVTSQQAAELDADPTVIITDRPERLAPFLLVPLLIGLGLLGWWRL